MPIGSAIARWPNSSSASVVSRRRRGIEILAAQSREAARFRAGERAHLSCLGPPDPSYASWHEAVPETAGALMAAGHPTYSHDRYRGGFRERYRVCLDHLLQQGKGLSIGVRHQIPLRLH